MCVEIHFIIQSIRNWVLDFQSSLPAPETSFVGCPLCRTSADASFECNHYCTIQCPFFGCNLTYNRGGNGWKMVRRVKCLNSSSPNAKTGQDGLGNQHSSVQLKTRKASETLLSLGFSDTVGSDQTELHLEMCCFL